MAGYDARKVGDWARKVTGGSLIPQKVPTKTRAQQKQEAAEKELDKYDLKMNQQGGFVEDEHSGLMVQPEAVTVASLLPSWASYSVSYRPTRIPPGKSLQFFNYPLTIDEDEKEAARKAEEERQQKLKAFADQIDAVGNAALVKVPEPETPKDIRIPDYTSCLVGWRGWRVKNGKLSALGIDAPWVPKMAVPAECRQSLGPLGFFHRDHRDSEAPHMDCSCGYWAFDSREKITQALEKYIGTVQVLGTVHLWGKIIKCENGFRAQYAYPKELWLLEPGLDHLSWTYGVPVRRVQKCLN